MADKDFNKELEDSSVYKIAHAIGIDISTYKANSEDSLKNVEAEIKSAIKKRQYENTEAQNIADLQKLADKPQLQQEYKEIKKEEKPNSEIEKDKVKQNTEDKSKEEKEQQASMGDLLRRLSGRPSKSSTLQTQTTKIPNPVRTTVKTFNTVNTVARLINNSKTK